LSFVFSTSLLTMQLLMYHQSPQIDICGWQDSPTVERLSITLDGHRDSRCVFFMFPASLDIFSRFGLPITPMIDGSVEPKILPSQRRK